MANSPDMVVQPVCATGMCENCEINPAEQDDFLCMDCISSMLIELDGDVDEEP